MLLYREQKVHRFQGQPLVTRSSRLLASLGGRYGGKSYPRGFNLNLPIAIDLSAVSHQRTAISGINSQLTADCFLFLKILPPVLLHQLKCFLGLLFHDRAVVCRKYVRAALAGQLPGRVNHDFAAQEILFDARVNGNVE